MCGKAGQGHDHVCRTTERESKPKKLTITFVSVLTLMMWSGAIVMLNSSNADALNQHDDTDHRPWAVCHAD